VTTAAPTARSPLTFFVLVLVLAVPFWLVGSVLEPPPGVPLSLPWTALMVVCPLGAAAILVSREEGIGGAGRLLRRALSPRGLRPIWYVPTVVLAPGLLALSYAMMRRLGKPLPDLQIAFGAIPVLFGLFFVASVCEEAGWTGYAVDPLQARWGALPTGVVVGLVWAAFHAVPWVQVHGPAWAMWQALSPRSACES
jgi:membrane protease YdiL (CAAX protease family)